MKVKDVVECINGAAPYNIACDWDNSGFLVGHEKGEVKKAMIALDFTGDVLSEALEQDCQLIITHHPYIFKGLTRITDETVEGKLVLKLIESGISLVSAHTNLDMANGGINDCLCSMLGLSDITQMGEITEGVGEFRMGYTDCRLSELVDKVKATLNCKAVKYNGDDDMRVKKVAVCSGSGCGFLDAAISGGAEAYLTADAKYHDFQTADAAGIALIDAGHFETENIICSKLSKLVGGLGLETVISTKHKGFYKTR